jgi:hypothetical protein
MQVASLTGNIFISYRRNDASANAGRLHDHLCERFGTRHVFMDVDDIEPGQDFVKVIDDMLDDCAALIVVMGTIWQSGENAERLEDSEDFVRLEIQRALERKVLIIPVLVKGASMPGPEQLPDAISAFARRQAFEIRDARFHVDINQLIDALEPAVSHGRGRRNVFRVLMAICVVAVLVSSFLWWAPVQQLFAPTLELRSTGTTLSVNQARNTLISSKLFATNFNPAGEGVGAHYEQRVLNGEEVILDSATRLMWHTGSADHQYVFHETQAFAGELNTNQYAGFNDWRIPTLEEARSIMQPMAVDGWYLDPIFGRKTAAFVWTSDLESADYGWLVYYISGDCNRDSLQFSAYVRAVRSY